MEVEEEMKEERSGNYSILEDMIVKS